jgi:hypothetical protein
MDDDVIGVLQQLAEDAGESGRSSFGQRKIYFLGKKDGLLTAISVLTHPADLGGRTI